MDIELAKLFFIEGILEYFEIKDNKIKSEEIHFYSDI